MIPPEDAIHPADEFLSKNLVPYHVQGWLQQMRLAEKIKIEISV